MDTSKLGDPEAVLTIKRLRRFQSVWVYQLCEPLLGPERKGHTPVDDPGSVHGRASTRHLNDLSTNLNAQERPIVNTISDFIGEADDRTTLKEVKILASTHKNPPTKSFTS